MFAYFGALNWEFKLIVIAILHILQHDITNNEYDLPLQFWF